MNKKKKHFAYRPSDHVVSKTSAIATVIGAAGIIIYLLLIAGSFSSGGKGNVLYGLAGWLVTALGAIGLYFAVRSFEDTAAIALWKITGCITNGLILTFSVLIFLLGIL